MPFATPTLDQTRSWLASFFRYLLPGRATSPLSFYGRLITWVAGAVTDVHAHVDATERDLMPDTAEGAGLDRQGTIWQTTRKGATSARGTAALRVTGTPAATVSIGDQLTDPDTELVYEVNSNGTVGAGNYVDVDVVAVDTGSRTRIAAGTVLEFVAAPAGITTQAELQSDLTDGTDQEQDGAHRLRVLATIGDRPLGGSQSDFVAWALEVTGISEAYCYPGRAGIGSVDVAALHAERGALTVGERADLLAYLQERAPAYLAELGADLRALTTVAEPVNVEILVTTDGRRGYAFDWDDTVPLEIDTWTPATRTILFTTALPASMQAGHRIVIRDVAVAGTGAELVIESIAAVDTIVIEEAPAVAPSGGDLVYSGGPLVQPIRAAVLAHLGGEIVYAGQGIPLPASTAASTVRLEVLAMPVGTANPDQAYGTWPGTLYRATLGRLASYARGVANVTISAPATDTEATDYAIPDDYQIGVLTAGRVIVRRA